MNGKRVAAALLAAAGVSLSSAHAQSTEEQAATPGSTGSTVQLEGITVITATLSEVPEERSPAAITSVPGAKIVEGNHGRIGDALRDVPGLFLQGSAFNNRGGNTGSITLRGIPGSSRTLIVMDGMPLNSANAGNVDFGQIPMIGLDRIEVTPGAFSSLYGNGAMGGVVNIISKAPEKEEFYAEGSIGGPTPKTQQGAAAYRNKLSNGLGYAVDFSFANGEGYIEDGTFSMSPTAPKPGTVVTPVTGATVIPTSTGGKTAWIGDPGIRPWQNLSTGLKLYYDISDVTKVSAGTSYGWSETGYGNPHSYLRDAAGNTVYKGWVSFADQNGVTRYANLDANPSPFLNLAPSGQWGWRNFVNGETKLGDVKLKANFNYTQRESFYILPKASSTLTILGDEAIPGGPGVVQTTPEERLLGTLQADIPLAKWNLLTVGGSWQYDTANTAVDDTSYHKDRDTKTGFRSNSSGGWSELQAAFIQDKIDLTDRLTAYIGGRYDYWTTAGSAWQTTTPVQPTLPLFNKSYDERNVGAFTPKASLVYLPVDSLTLRASAGQAFNTPNLLQLYSRSQTTQTIITEGSPDLKPETVTSWEAGGEWRIAETGTKLRATYYENYLEDLIYSRQTSQVIDGKTYSISYRTNAGQATVKGIEAGIEQKLPIEGLSASFNVTHNDSEIIKNDAAPATVGKMLTYTPEWMVHAGLDYVNGPWRASLSAHYMSKFFTDDQNRDVSTGIPTVRDPYFLIDGKVSYEFEKGWTVSLIGNNLLDEHYYDYYIMPGRTIFGQISYKY